LQQQFSIIIIMFHHQHPTVLLVEDDDHIARLLKFILERQGYRVVHLADGRAAVNHVASSTFLPDVVLLDLMLPYVDGFEIVRQIRARARWAAVPVLILSGRSTERDTVRAFDAGADDFITKPFQPNELLARMRRYVKLAA
jgi:DNA-binding response OmpR family regulator